MKKGFLAFNLIPESRNLVLSKFPAKFNNVVAHHITYKFKVTESEPIPEHCELKVIGYSSNENIECLVVEVNGSIVRPDQKVYHLTLSHNDGAKPVHSNDLLAEQKWTSLDPFTIKVKACFNPF